MRRLLLLSIGCFLFVHLSFAQDQLTGRVYENKTKVFLQGIKVENLKSHIVTQTSNDGSFSIKAAVGDLVSFSNYNYKTDTVYLLDLKYIQIFLEPRINLLQEVTVTNQQIKGNAGFVATPEKGPLGSQTVTYQLDPTFLKPVGGVNISVPDGGETKRKHEERVNETEKEKEEIRKVFNGDNLKKFLPITGQEMDNFVILYMPDRQTYYNPAFNLVGYVNGCYEEFVKIPVEERQSKELTQLVKAKE